MALPQGLRSLLTPAAYPHPVAAVQLVETHISWILLTGEFAYKIKRPVQLPFVDQRSLEHRAFLCAEELRLNHRFAPDLYLGVCDITQDGSGIRISGSGAVIEHAVKMRQFDRNDGLDRLLDAQCVEPAELERFGRQLARIHAGLPTVHHGERWGHPDTVRMTVLRNAQESARLLPDDYATRVLAIQTLLESQLGSAARWMKRRWEGDKVRECHGDLHCSNVVRLGSELTAFDGLEFEPAFRWIDVADEVGFLCADLAALDRPAHAQAFLGGYLAESGDFDLCPFLRVYATHRSLVRAKVEALSAIESTASRRMIEAHLECAWRFLHPRRPALVLVSGVSGSGKTWLAQRLAPGLDAIHLRSDVERKRLSGFPESARTGSALGQGVYSLDLSGRVYQHLASAARSTLAGGFTTLVDATFGRRADRLLFRDLARELGVPICLVRCSAPPEVLRERLVARGIEGKDASEADASVLAWQEEHWQPIRPTEALPVIEASTADPEVMLGLRRDLAMLHN